ncbi:desmocollin 2-like protein [Tachysurus vachellii]|uniref:desmocollin 2-like protein n=1 Tax=Tachysurus vachellii TaxID=175792 RepID=UPI00296A8FDB|nr:desmocollin 2-like protein [Tachysurus vachellii]
MSRVCDFCHVLFLLLLCYSVESCVQKHIQAQVPVILERGDVVSHVNLDGCGDGPLGLISSDPAFRVEIDGTIQTVLATKVPEDGLYFWITVQDLKGNRWFVDVSLSSTDQGSKNAVLKRSKRRWSPPPFSVKENEKGPFPRNMEMIASDTSVNYSLFYVLKGPGVTLPPIGLFSVIPNTGMLKVHNTIDREQYPKFVFTAYAYNTLTNKETDDPLPITVIIEDENDNAPQFSGLMDYTVEEQCPMNTVVGEVTATDKDEPNTLHTKIKYTLKNGTNLFRIDPYSGFISAATNILDREAQETHFLEIEIRDMGGASNGLFSKGVARVSLTDINDNPPIFTQTTYKGSVPENKADVLVAKIPVNDKDLINTPNWKAVYEITKGNENGNFMIKTDPVTNEGQLYVKKPLDYEKQQTVNLEVMARNEAPLDRSSSTWQKVPVGIMVEDVDEGPEFSVPILQLKVKENVANGTIIGVYTAIDPETKNSKDITYYKLSDPGSWISVVSNTGELKTVMTIDRESALVVNNTYNITVKAVDKSQKTGTGTVIILIEDVNDNTPVISNLSPAVCNKGAGQSSVVINATDLDQQPYSYPFLFELVKPNDGSWRLKDQKATSVVLEPAVDLPNDIYQVPILVKDLQGFGKEQTLTVRLCDCTPDGLCAPQKLSTALGVWGILAMLLGLLLLLLLCLLCVFVCSTKGEKLAMAEDDFSGGMLLKSNLEAPGEEVKDALILLPTSGVDIMDGSKGGGYLEHQTTLSSGGAGFGQKQIFGENFYHNNHQGFMTNTFTSGQYGTGMYGNSFKNHSTMSAMDGWQENGSHLNKKLTYFREEAEGRFADDILKPYGFEGMGSPAGSVGCCSVLLEENSLDFLNSLGPKFKTLADVCTSKSPRGGQ